MKQNWTYKKFDDCIDKVNNTLKVPSSDYLDDGAFPIISQEERLISGYWNDDAYVFHLHKPIVIFGDHTRVLKYVDFDFVLGADGVKILQPIDDLSAKFLLHYLTWCNIPSLGYSRHYKLLKELYIPVPPLSEQSRVVSELDLLQSIIDKQQAQLKELDTLAQAVLYDMFGDPVENEKGWETDNLKTVAPQKQYNGIVPSTNGKFWLLNLDMVEQQTGSIIEKVLCDQNEIGNSTIIFDTTNVLYSKLRPYLNKVVLPDEIGYGTSELVPLKPNTDVLDRVFLAYLLRSKSFVNYISVKVAGAKMPRVSMDILRDFLVIQPPISLQQSFTEKIEAIERQKAIINQSLTETQKLFDYTMDKCFG